jgi:hypothetical protein
MQKIVCNRASSVGIPTALDAEKVREINDFLLDNMGSFIRPRKKKVQDLAIH